MSPRWQAAVGYALVGEEPAVDEPGHPDAAALVAGLAEAGWSSDRIAGHARALLAADGVWPHPVPAELRAGCGAAQLHAAIAAARAILDLVSMEKRPPSGRSRLNPDERRLMAEVPPHHGH